MFKSLDLNHIDSQIETFYLKFLSEKTENLRNQVLMSPTQYSEVPRQDLTRLFLYFRKLSEKETLAIASWYFPEEIRFIVQLELSETWGAEDLEVKEVLLTSKDLALTWLMRCSRWNEFDFFGNHLSKAFARLWNLTEFRKLSVRKVKRYTGYCRGHQDVNRGVPSSLRRENWAKRSVLEEMEFKLRQEQKTKTLFNRVQNELFYLSTGINPEWFVS